MPRTRDQEEELRIKDKAISQLSRPGVPPLDRLRLLCLARSGSSGILSLGRLFRRLDDNKSGSLSRQEFISGLEEVGFSEGDQLFNLFDSNKSDTIDYNEFLVHLRPMNDQRMKLVMDAFDKLDSSKDGEVTVNDLKSKYSVKENPDYVSGRRTEQEILQDFLNKFGSHDQVLTKQEFIEYYSGVSASIDDDLYFDLIMRRAWRL